jgi:hypothetical protein
MGAIQRVGVTLTTLAAGGLLFLVLTYVGAGSQGPIERVLTQVGALVSDVETRVAHRMRAPGRSAELAWFAPYRQDVDALRRPASVLLGTYDNRFPESIERVWRLEQALETRFPLIHFFTAWGDKVHQQFPGPSVRAIRAQGSVPVITWEPWLADFDPRIRPHLPSVEERDTHGLAAIARGDYDFYVSQWAREAAAYGDPILVRLGHEMNDAYRYPWGPHNNRPEEYVAAFRHVVEVFRRAGATNVLWVWSPHIAYDGFEAYYPGDDVVDWVATAVLNYGNVAYWSQWWTFEEIFERKYERLAAFGKPIMIAEFGTLIAGGERAPWLEAALTNLPDRLPQVRSVMFFHNDRDATVTYQALNWAFVQDSLTAASVRRAVAPWAPRPVIGARPN